MPFNTVESIRKLCLSFSHTTEHVQWGDNLVFKIAGKMFAVAPLIPARVFVTVKASDESFAELTERPGIIPAPYLARAKWVALEHADAVSPAELALLLRTSYDLVVAKLPARSRASFSSVKPKSKSAKPARSAHKRKTSRRK
jgi:predicted DNA-binding protein (MmcQ/YjbR family)